MISLLHLTLMLITFAVGITFSVVLHLAVIQPCNSPSSHIGIPLQTQWEISHRLAMFLHNCPQHHEHQCQRVSQVSQQRMSNIFNSSLLIHAELTLILKKEHRLVDDCSLNTIVNAMVNWN